ncbi:hypothetical protein Btru_053167 [Bulinus truncatus]|nr:hypothetical protein Btru_053167 [Bulinus truncatus]
MFYCNGLKRTSETHYDADLRKKVSTGLYNYFRRGHRTRQKYAGIKMIAVEARAAMPYVRSKDLMQARATTDMAVLTYGFSRVLSCGPASNGYPS